MGTGGPAMLCRHVWIANSGRGGEPQFRVNRQIPPWVRASSEPLMDVTCRTCGTRSWFTEAQWNTLAAEDEK
jgi:hypothetical protein